MIRTRLTRPLLVLLAAGALACRGGDTAAPPAPTQAPGAGTGELVAEIDGQPITSGDLDEWIKDEMLRQALASKSGSELYEFRADALESLLEKRALDAEAARKGVTTDQVIADEVTALGPVSDDEVQEFYKRHESRLHGATLEQMAPRIRSFLEHEKRSEALKRVRDRADVVVHLEPPRVEVAATGPSVGPQDAPVTIVEFTDYQCPFCRRAEPTIKDVVQRYPDRVRWVVRNLPLDNIHPHARGAAYAAVCAEKQDHFWQFHDKLFASQDKLEDKDLVAYAKEMGLDVKAFNTCRESDETRARVDDDVEAARKIGVSGTPAFFVNGIQLTGAKPAEDFVRLIERELASSGETTPPAS